MGLKEELAPLTGRKRRYLILRIAGLEPEVAKKLTNIKTGTYNSWCAQPEFVQAQQRIDELSVEYRLEAIQLMRRENQLEAVIFEQKVLAEMQRELEERDYNLIRTQIGKEVYVRLISEVGTVPQGSSQTWTTFIGLESNPNQIEQLSQARTTDVEVVDEQTLLAPTTAVEADSESIPIIQEVDSIRESDIVQEVESTN